MRTVIHAVILVLTVATCLGINHNIIQRKKLKVSQFLITRCGCSTFHQSHQIHFGSGYWVHRNQTEEEIEWDLRSPHCAINILGHRHTCPTEKVFRTRQWHWEGSGGFPSLVRCPHDNSSSSPHLLDSRLNGKLIAFWGDSLTLQFYVGFVCSFYAAGAMVEKEKDAPSKIEISRIYWISNRGPVITLRAASVVCP